MTFSPIFKSVIGQNL